MRFVSLRLMRRFVPEAVLYFLTHANAKPPSSVLSRSEIPCVCRPYVMVLLTRAFRSSNSALVLIFGQLGIFPMSVFRTFLAFQIMSLLLVFLAYVYLFLPKISPLSLMCMLSSGGFVYF